MFIPEQRGGNMRQRIEDSETSRLQSLRKEGYHITVFNVTAIIYSTVCVGSFMIIRMIFYTYINEGTDFWRKAK